MFARHINQKLRWRAFVIGWLVCLSTPYKVACRVAKVVAWTPPLSPAHLWVTVSAQKGLYVPKGGGAVGVEVAREFGEEYGGVFLGKVTSVSGVKKLVYKVLYRWGWWRPVRLGMAPLKLFHNSHILYIYCDPSQIFRLFIYHFDHAVYQTILLCHNLTFSLSLPIHVAPQVRWNSPSVSLNKSSS